MRALDDRALAALCADGDASGWTELLARHDRRVLLVLLRAGVPEHELADLRQELYARLLAQQGAALRGLKAERPGALGAFLAQAALRAAIDHGRARGTRTRREVLEEEAHALPSTRGTPEEEAAHGEHRKRFASALLAAAAGAHLARDLMILRAHFSDGLNAEEIAGMGCGLAPKGVETLLRRARLRIEEEMAEGKSAAGSSLLRESR